MGVIPRVDNMHDILEEIRNGLRVNLYYLSLFVALSMPDICGALDSPDGKANGTRYAHWFDTYVAPKYHGFLSGDDCWMFRCSLLHEGRTQHPKSTYSRIMFVEPTTTTNIFHNNVLNDALNIDVRIFCLDIIEGAEKWLQKVENTELYKTNYNGFIRRYPKGLRPYMAGVPVIS